MNILISKLFIIIKLVRMWNKILENVCSAQSLNQFQSRLERPCIALNANRMANEEAQAYLSTLPDDNKNKVL